MSVTLRREMDMAAKRAVWIAVVPTDGGARNAAGVGETALDAVISLAEFLADGAPSDDDLGVLDHA